jgi:hypothetical protein
LLVVFLTPTAVLTHSFWKETDPQARQMEMIGPVPEGPGAGAALMLLGLIAHAGSDLGLTLTGPLFDIT